MEAKLLKSLSSAALNPGESLAESDMAGESTLVDKPSTEEVLVNGLVHSSICSWDIVVDVKIGQNMMTKEN